MISNAEGAENYDIDQPVIGELTMSHNGETVSSDTKLEVSLQAEDYGVGIGYIQIQFGFIPDGSNTTDYSLVPNLYYSASDTGSTGTLTYDQASSTYSTAISSNETIFYITRHAETEANINGLLVGSGGDSPLTAKGQEQANALGKGLYGIHFDKCFTSEMGRAQNTAKAILDQSNNKNIKIETDPGLNDLNWGSLEGKSITEVAAGRTDFKIEDVIGDGSDPNFTSESGSETRYTCTKRLTEAMDQLAKDKNNKGKRILITAHSSMAWFIGNVTGDGAKYASIDNASVSVLIYKNQKWKVMDFNDTDYSTMKERLSKY